MSTNNNSLQERGAEWKAAAGAEQIVRILTEAASDPSTKRFLKGRPSRIERWTQLEALAAAQVRGLTALAKSAPAKRKARAPLTVAEPPPSGEPQTVVN